MSNCRWKLLTVVCSFALHFLDPPPTPFRTTNYKEPNLNFEYAQKFKSSISSLFPKDNLSRNVDIQFNMKIPQFVLGSYNLSNLTKRIQENFEW